MHFQDLSDIDWIKLRDEFNIRAICFDKDNTITAPYCQNLHFSVLVFIFFDIFDIFCNFMFVKFLFN